VITGDDRLLVPACDDVLIGGGDQSADEFIGVRVDGGDRLPTPPRE
jgi:hypothetical protein